MNNKKCTVSDGKFVSGCNGMRSAEERGRVYEVVYKSWIDGKPTHSFYVVKSSARDGGMAMNYCPFCGESISAPFEESIK